MAHNLAEHDDLAELDDPFIIMVALEDTLAAQLAAAPKTVAGGHVGFAREHPDYNTIWNSDAHPHPDNENCNDSCRPTWTHITARTAYLLVEAAETAAAMGVDDWNGVTSWWLPTAVHTHLRELDAYNAAIWRGTFISQFHTLAANISCGDAPIPATPAAEAALHVMCNYGNGFREELVDNPEFCDANPLWDDLDRSNDDNMDLHDIAYTVSDTHRIAASLPFLEKEPGTAPDTEPDNCLHPQHWHTSFTC